MQFLEVFLKHLKDIYHSHSSYENYYYILKRAQNHFTQGGITDERLITEKDILNYIQHLVQEVQSDWIHFRSVLYLKVYFNYLEKERIIFLNPMRNIEVPKEIRNPTKIMTQEEITKIFSQINTATDAGIRLRTVLELMYSSSLRPGEVTNITLTDIDYIGETIFIRLAKNKKDRVVPVGKSALEWLKKYIKEVRPKYLKDSDNPYVFLAHNRTGKKINYLGLYYLIAVNLKRNNIPHFRPFSLRPSSATHMLQNGMGLLHIKEILGHEEVTTTKQYLRVNEQDLRKQLEARHPGFNRTNQKGENHAD
jgi:integrase/recombinase XerD